MNRRDTLLESLGGEEGCRRLSAEFYARVAKDSVLRRLFPGKTLRCATEAFGAFLIQFLGGDEDQTQERWSLSLRQSHAHFGITQQERSSWLKQMSATLDAIPADEETRNALRKFFAQSAAYVVGEETGDPEHVGLASRWSDQRCLDRLIAAIGEGRDEETLAIAPRFAARPAVFVGIMARMVQTSNSRLIRFVVDSVERTPSLITQLSSGRTLLHFAAGAGCVEVVDLLLRLGAAPDIRDLGDHTPLYRAANECGSAAGPVVVRNLVRSGADVNACSGVTRATALHMAARRGHLEIARTLLDCGASLDTRDRKGDTPLQRAVNCRRKDVAQLLAGAADKRSSF